MKKNLKRIITFILSIVLLMQSILLNDIKAVGVGGDVVVSGDILRQYSQLKELDISESKIEIVIKQEEKDNMRKQAEESAYKWYRNVRILEDHPIDDLVDMKDTYGFHNKYWHEGLDCSDMVLTDETRQFLEEYDAAGNIENFLNGLNAEQIVAEAKARIEELSQMIEDAYSRFYNNEITLDELDEITNQCWDETNDLDAIVNRYESIQTTLRGKIEEIYNDKFADLLAERIAGNLPYSVEFEIQIIPDDELEKFKVDGTNIKKGNLNDIESLKAGSIDFNAENQFYDEVLKDGVNRIEEYIADDTHKFLIKDGRDYVDHVLYIDGGYLRSSDGSQEAHAGLRNNNYYPGEHCLLEYCDPLATYYGPLLQIPDASYIRAFSLHLNPAISYYVTEIEADLISDVEFDDEGKLTKIAKPILLDKDAVDALSQANTNQGAYRFKFIEREVENNLFENGAIINDTSEKFLDFIVKVDYGDVYASYQIGELDNLPTNYDLDTYTSEFFQQDKVLQRNQTATFKNKIATTDIKVTKTWEDEDNKDKLRPDLNTFVSKIHLYADKEEIKVDKTTEDGYLAYKEIKEDKNVYTIEFKNLPKYNKEGKEIVYTITEDKIDGYETTIDKLNITNKHTPVPPPNTPPKREVPNTSAN